MLKIVKGEKVEMTAEEVAEFERIRADLAMPELQYSLTARQIRLGLVLNGIDLPAVEAAIAGIEDPHQRAVATIEWEYASQFERGHPLIAQVGAALGLTEDQISEMWASALG